MKTLITISTFFISLFLTLEVGAQSPTLQQKYDSIIETSETFKQYKLIPERSINAFWSEVTNSMSQSDQRIEELEKEIVANQGTIKSLNTQVATVQANLDESLNANDSINFLGISFSKLAYHILVWVIIIVLIVLGLVAYFMFLRSNKLTTRFKKDLVSLTSEFDDHKDKARESQMKLKRELQTAMNQLNERR
ncbi:MAG: hypothetical protein AB8B73_07430 [Ekhidna sp.]